MNDDYIIEGIETLNEEEDSLLKNYDKDDIYPEANIKVERSQYSLFELHRKYDKKQLILDPDFQREEVWNMKQKSELIESVIMGIPLPIFYLNETKEGKLVVIDGRQRLTTFFSYFKNEFRLKNLKILKDINDSLFDELEAKMIAVLEDFQIVAQVIKPPTEDRIKFDIFDRVNRGGTPLNNQEMRNALYQGKSTKLLGLLVREEAFKKVTGGTINSNRMKDRYLVLRFLSFYMWKNGYLKDLKGNDIEYKNDIDEFLGSSMEFLNNCNDEQINFLFDIFKKSMENNYTVFGDQAFRRMSNNERKNPINMILFESFSYFFAFFDNNYCIENKQKIKKACESLLLNPELNKLLTEDRGRGIVIHEVFSMFDKLRKSVLNDN